MSAYASLAPLYDDLTNDVDYKQFADFYEQIFNKRGKTVKTLLDVGCGTGTLTCIMAQRGYEMIAADSSVDMLCVAREKAAELQNAAQPLFLCQSMTELDLYGTVDAAVSCLDAVNYLPPEDMSDFFELLHLFIEQGGLFIFDINTPERLRALDGYTSVDEDEDKLCLWRADFDEEENALFYGMDIFTRRGRLWQRSFEEHIEYAHSPEKLKTQLEEAGFINVELCADGPQHELGRLFIIAENTCGQKR
ncbi:MAG: class I SAM-dependent DNA methyltransferase [Oscillospiraceae bacterium]|nr:class I SAM-dependent methyltransferase [Oscillospiraceae bacterium]